MNTKLPRSSSRLTVLALAVGVLAFAGCDKEDPEQKKACEGLATHMAEVVQKEQGEEVGKEQVDKMIESTVGACMEHPPTKEAMDCAMKATDTTAMKACDPKEEDEKAEE